MKTLLAILAVALLTSSPFADARSRKKPKPPEYPVTKVVAGHPREPQVYPLNEDTRSIWFAFYAMKPLVMNPENTARVIQTHFAAYMDEPLCQAMPTLYINFSHERWGVALYENMGGNRYHMLRHIRQLVQANCAAPDVVKTIKLAVFSEGLTNKLFDKRYLDHFDDATREKVGLAAARYVYFGLIDAANGYELVHQDPDGLARYQRTNRELEATVARMQAYEDGEAELREGGLGVIFGDYCKRQPAACVSLGLVVLGGSGGGGSSSSSPTFAQCMNACQIRGPESLGTCQSRCYEFVAK